MCTPKTNMKTVIVVAALLTLCSGHVIPEDNSHYVEGVSRYVWMPDADGSNVLVDLEEPVDEELLNINHGANNQYWLYTRGNPHIPQLMVHGDWDSVFNYNYERRRSLKVFVHGWRKDGNSSMNHQLTSEFLAREDCNVIVVDWQALASSTYNTAVAGVESVGIRVGLFVLWLMNITGGNWNQIHLVGFGLGAHVVGVAGRHTGGRIPRITGLDPAGPGWHNNINRLNPNFGQYVEAIHTDGHVLGIFIRSGDADFYPNGGRHPQPGCRTHVCSHNFAIELFAQSIRFNIYGNECDNLTKISVGTCNGAEFPIGNDDINKRGSGVYLVRGRPPTLLPSDDSFNDK